MDKIKKFGLVDIEKMNEVINLLKTKYEEDQLIKDVTTDPERLEVIRAYQQLLRDKRNNKNPKIINFLNKSEKLRKKMKGDVVDVDEAKDEGRAVNVDDGTPLVIKRGSKQEYVKNISKYLKKYGIDGKNFEINKRKYNFSFEDFLNDFSSNKQTRGLTDQEIDSLLPNLKRINFPVSYINNKYIKEKYKATAPAITTPRGGSQQRSRFPAITSSRGGPRQRSRSVSSYLDLAGDITPRTSRSRIPISQTPVVPRRRLVTTPIKPTPSPPSGIMRNFFDTLTRKK